MTAQATTRLKVSPALGSMPVLSYMPPQQLEIDDSYQRELAASAPSQMLIRRIAMHWDWGLCQPLVVSRRLDGGAPRHFVIDGQHRLAAARLRSDISVLPCVISEYESAADEAARFVHLNQQRRPLSKLDLFKAAVASGDVEAAAIIETMAESGLDLARHGNPTAWKPGQVCNIGGIEQAWRVHGQAVCREAMEILAAAFQGQVLRYAGTIWPGIVAVVADEMKGGGAFDTAMRSMFIDMLGQSSQTDWQREINQTKADNPGLKFSAASGKCLLDNWGECVAEFLDEPQ